MAETTSPYRAINDQYDQQAKDLVCAYYSGSQTPDQERHVRGQLAAIVIQARVAEQVVFGRYRFSGQVGHDLVDEIVFDIEKKIAAIRDTARSHSTLDLEMIRSGRSLLGWARQMMKMTALSKHRDIRARAAKSETFTGIIREDPSESQRASAASIRLEAALATDDQVTAEDQRFDQALDTFDRMLTSTDRRPRELMHPAAVGVLTYLGISGRPVATVDGRRALERLLQTTPSLPLESLAAWVALVEGTMTASQQSSIPDLALRFWDGLTLAEASTLLESGPRTTALVMRGFIAGAIRPTDEQIAQITDAASALLPESAEESVPEAVSAVIATRCSRVRADGSLSPLRESQQWDDLRVDLALKRVATCLGAGGRIERIEEMVVRLTSSVAGLAI